MMPEKDVPKEKAKPRVLVVSNRYPHPGKVYAGIYVKRHVALHQEAGYLITVAAPPENRTRYFRMAMAYLVFSLRVFRHMVMERFDIVHAHWPFPAGLFGMIVSTWQRIPLLVTSHGAYVDNFDSQNKVVQYLVRKCLKKSKRIIAVGNKHAEQVARVAEIPVGAIQIINMGVWIPPVIPDRALARQALGLSDKEQIVVFIGNLLYGKGVDIIIRALHHLHLSGESVRLIIGGQGPEIKKIVELIDRYDLKQSVTMIGSVSPDKVFTWFSAADVCVVPSRTESFGSVAVEAMASGTPVIAADVGGLAENIKHGENGLLFPVGDHKALAACLKTLLGNPELGQRLVEKSRGMVSAFDMRKQAAKVAEMYDQI